MGRKESNQTNKIIADAKTVPTYMYMLYVKLSCVFYLNQSMKYSDCVFVVNNSYYPKIFCLLGVCYM